MGGDAADHSPARGVLQGVAGRFSRDDLFTAILQPSKDISPRYRTTLIATPEGKAYVQNLLAPKIKAGVEKAMAGQLNGARPVRL